jgi:hypothetical protein
MQVRCGALVVVGLAVLLGSSGARAQFGSIGVGESATRGVALLPPTTSAPATLPAPPPAAVNAPLPPGNGTSFITPNTFVAPPPAPACTPLPPAYSTCCSPAATCCCDGQPAPFTPFMLGDFVGFVANNWSDLKIAEGESPRPVNRVFYKFNWYNNVAPAQWADPTQPIHNVNLYRHVFGFEQTFVDGRFSVGLRVPFNTLDADAKSLRPGEEGIDSTQFGNVNGIFKALLWEDRGTGDVLSAGATISLPTASSHLLNPGQSTLLYVQPFGGFLFNNGDLFVQGFVSVTAPVAHAESIVLFTDVGVGYWLYRNPHSGMLTAFVPTVELHIADPLRQADPTVNNFGIYDTLKLHNVFDLTLGGTFEFASRTTLGLGIVFPLTAPRPFDVEALAQLNYRF